MNENKYTPEMESKYIKELSDLAGGKEIRGHGLNKLWNHETKHKYQYLIDFINYKTPLLQDSKFTDGTSGSHAHGVQDRY
jgi:hypothetical protein